MDNSSEICLRRSANRSEVRPRTAEQGFGAAWSKGAHVPRSGARPRTAEQVLRA